MEDSPCDVAVKSDAEEPVSLREQLLALHERRKRIEKDVHEALMFLESTPVGMTGRLIDGEGFPRADCDLYAVRQARNTVSCGQNDLRAITDELYEKIGTLHDEHKAEAGAQMVRDEEKRRQGKAEAEARQRRREAMQRIERKVAFVKVAEVEADSPAYEAGLQVGMLILQFGDLDAEGASKRGLASALGAITQEHEGRVLSVWTRNPAKSPAEMREHALVPQRWSGRGLLGCSFDPI